MDMIKNIVVIYTPLLLAACVPVYQSQGYSNAYDYKFGKEIGADAYTINILKKYGITSAHDIELSYDAMEKDGYSKERTIQKLYEYLKDRKAASENKVPNVSKYREKRIAEEATLRSYGINSEAAAAPIMKKMIESGYATTTNNENLILFLKDQGGAIQNNMSIFAYREKRISDEKERANREIAEQKALKERQYQAEIQRREYIAKNYPYEAIFSCYSANQFTTPIKTYVGLCFSGKNDLDTAITLINNKEMIKYSSVDILTSRNIIRDNLVIPLTKSFSIAAQNKSNNNSYYLSLTINEVSSRKIMFSKTVPVYGVISVNNK